MKKIKDEYYQRAKREGFAARSVYKLEEIDRRCRLLRAGARVLDLGAAPGSWLQYAAGRCGREGGVVGLDLEPITAPLPGWVTTIRGDLYQVTAEELMEGGGPFDLLLSDAAPKTTGIPSGDAARSAALVEQVLQLSGEVLAPGGALLAKLYQGGQLPELRRSFSLAFNKVTLEKPKASRAESVEVFLLGRDKKR